MTTKKENVLSLLVNWKTVLTAFTISALTLVGNDVWTIRTKTIEAHLYMLAHQEQYNQEIKPLLNSIKDRLEAIDKAHRTVAGKAMVIPESEGDSRTYVLINELGPASVHRTAKRVKVTNLTSDRRPSFEFEVRGTYSNGSEDDHVIALSHSAARLLQLREASQNCVVLIEPLPD